MCFSFVWEKSLPPFYKNKSFSSIIWFFFFLVKVNPLTFLSIVPLLRVFRKRWTDWVVGESRHGDHVYSVCRGPLLYRDVPGAYPSLYSEGGGPGHCSSEVIGGISKRGKERVLMLMVNPKPLLLPLHRHLLHSERSRRKTWRAIYHVFLHAFLLWGPARRSLSLSSCSWIW